MKFKSLIFSIAILSLGCLEREGELIKLARFEIPVVVNSNNQNTISGELFKEKYLSGGYPYVAGKFNFQDTVDIWHKSGENELYKERKMYDNSWRDSTNLDVNGFDIIPDYSQTIYVHSYLGLYYPVFIVNSTASRKVFLGQDSYGFGIQEALNMENYYQWRAIEGQIGDWGGTGKWTVIVNPNEFIILLFKKYEGEYETDLRVRIKNGASIYVSKKFCGRINYGQFYLHPDADLIKNVNSISHWFHGATISPKDPNELQW